MRGIFILFFLISAICLSKPLVDRYLVLDKKLSLAARRYYRDYGSKIDSSKLNAILLKYKIYDSDHVFISGNFKSTDRFKKHIEKKLSWKIRKYNYYGYYRYKNSYFGIILKKYLDLTYVGVRDNDLFEISGRLYPDVKKVMAYFQGPEGGVFHILPSNTNNRGFVFRFTKDVGYKSKAFELIVETKHNGRKVANIIRKYVDHGKSLMASFANPREAEMFLLKKINNERVSRGMLPLEPHYELAKVALKHSVKMAEKGLIFHSGKEDIAKLKNYYSNVSENVAASRFITDIHRGFVNSPLHFKNMLEEEVTKVGIGIHYAKKDGKDYIYATQIFYKPENVVVGRSLVSEKGFLSYVNKQRIERGVPPLKVDNALFKETKLFLKRENNLNKLSNFLSLSNLKLKRIAYNRLQTYSLYSVKKNPAFFEKTFTHLALILPKDHDPRKNSLIVLASYKKQ